LQRIVLDTLFHRLASHVNLPATDRKISAAIFAVLAAAGEHLAGSTAARDLFHA
jgi:hypothetical protein